LEFVEKRSTTIDTQRVLVQEILDNAQGGEQPKTMSAEFMGDLCGIVFPGDRVIINAVLRSYQVVKGGQPSPVFRTYLDVNNVEIFEREYEEVEIAEEDERTIKALSKEKDILIKIARSIAPSVYGMMPYKQAISLALFSGNQAHNQYGESKRMDIHVLGCGDPALAKSKVARYACRVAPRAVITSGLSSSKAGLTVSITRDEIDGRWVVDAGAMCLADRGLFFMDELGDLPKPDQAILHEAMEEQTCSYAKAGLVGHGNTRCATISCMNPKRGRFDLFADLADQVDVKPALLSRFDLVYLMIDQPAKEYDAGVSSAILDDNEPTENTPIRDDIIQVELLRKYIAFSKKQKNPILSPESKKILSDYYLKVRGDAKQGAPIPITARAMDTLKRLSISHAKMRLSDTVTIKDAELAVKVLDESLKNVATDPTTGKQDIDRVSGGQSKRKRDLAANVVDAIRSIHAKQGACRKNDIEARLMELKISYGDSELERLLESLKQTGDLTESKGLYRCM
jgi:replicative DNA helicase Mcm